MRVSVRMSLERRGIFSEVNWMSIVFFDITEFAVWQDERVALSFDDGFTDFRNVGIVNRLVELLGLG